MTDTIRSRGGLVARIDRLDPAGKALLRERWPAGVPGLKTEHEHSNDELHAISDVLDSIDGTIPPVAETAVPDALADRVAEVVDALRELPADLLEQVTAAAQAQGVPNLQSPAATDAHVDAVAALVQEARDTWRQRVVRVVTACSRVFDGDEDLRRAFTAYVTRGTAGSSKTLTAAEADAVVDACTALELGWIELGYTADGVPVFSQGVDWKTVARQRGTTQAALLKEAKQQAAADGRPTPKRLDELEAAAVARLMHAFPGSQIVDGAGESTAPTPEGDASGSSGPATESAPAPHPVGHTHAVLVLIGADVAPQVHDVPLDDARRLLGGAA